MVTDAGTRIKRARERRRWTQRQLADALGVNIKTVDNWENGRTSPKNSLGALEQVLGISLDDEPGRPERWPHVPPTLVDAIEDTGGLTDAERRAVLGAVERTLASERGEGPPPVPGFRARPEREQPAS